MGTKVTPAPQYYCAANPAVGKDLNNGTLSVVHHANPLDGLWQNIKRNYETNSTDYPKNNAIVLNASHSLMYNLEDVRTRYKIAPHEIRRANPNNLDLRDNTPLDDPIAAALIMPNSIYTDAKCRQVK